MFLNQDYGMIHIAQNNAASVVNDATRTLLHDGRNGLGVQTAIIGAFNKIAPNLSPDLQQKLFSGGNLDTNLQGYLHDQQLTAMTQYDSRQTGKPYTLSRAMDQLQQRASATGKTTADPDSYQALMNLAQGITTKDPHMSDSAKLNLSVFFYDKDNLGLLNKWQNGYIDPATKAYVPGRQDVLKTLSSPEITKELWRQSQNGHPDVWENYKNWVTSEMGAQIRSDAANLNDIQAQAGGPTGQYQPKLSYDSDNHKIIIKNPDGSDLTGLQATRMNLPYRTVQNLNAYIGNMSEIAKHDGFGVDAFVAKSLLATGTNANHPIIKAMTAAAKVKDANRDQ